MSPNPRSRIKYPDDGSGRGLRGRLNLLLILMTLQVVLMIGIWMNISNMKQTGHPANTGQASEPVIEAKETSQLSSKPTDTQKPNRIKPETAGISSQKAVKSETPVETLEPSPINIQVLNGGAKGGLAGRTGKWLEKNGYNVKDIGNADRSDYRYSQIIDRSGNLTAARELASLLGIKEEQIKRLKLMPEPEFDLTLILGRDYRRLSIGR
ncbi:LytR C-terminal domain-containing protein [bacterium]|nr:LytR C-terminal domain-containing protein [bacterium]